VEFECEVKELKVPSEKRDDDWLLSLKSEERLWNVYAQLTNGRVVGCDFVVSATGVTPSGSAIPFQGLQVVEEGDGKGAIVVNERMETNIKDIFAAGDVCKVTCELLV